MIVIPLFTFFLLFLLVLPGNQLRATEVLTLQDAIRESLERNPSAGMERERLRQFEADYRSTRAGLLPHLSAVASYTQLAPDRLAMTSQPGAALYEREVYGGIGLSQLLFDGKTVALRKAASTAALAQEELVASMENLAAYQTAKAFIQVLEARTLFQTSAKAAERARAFEEMTSTYFNAGKVTRLDLLQARSGRLEAEASLVRAKELEHSAMALLGALIGREDLDFKADGCLPDAVAPVPPYSMAIKSAMARNPDILRLRKLIERAGHTADAARGARYPTVGAKANWGYRDRDLGGGEREWTAGLQLDLPIYDGGAIGAGIAKSEASLAESREAERAGRLAVQSQLRSELSAWRTAAADVRAAEESIAAAREALDAAETLYRFGKATALDVLSAQLDLAKAETLRTGALADYAIARSGTDLLIGTAPAINLNSQGGTP
ncbi:MAG: TolC family protein [Chlorobium sp.]|uniref:TolC family protein n=1 Tax=Chlorobium sp. TaxID=1095 RepID=UPI001D1F6336|nr:TolC family protein [Chlorobium sp.]MBN1278970.1 TolC family protein [Chlorobiaceae bacterium]MCF8216618.1 TolC family protein [Chlorobium sp.]MCF8271488.1 TolC family protein [Chlorobium sp.]MCF8287860.1 TolC family protein [Chlorobium sp.]MCF8291451.1 TolC family protein [Chlorobium sp.]